MMALEMAPVILFPAHAGVIPAALKSFCSSAAFPRTRGGDPHLCDSATHPPPLFPAHAGVILESL